MAKLIPFFFRYSRLLLFLACTGLTLAACACGKGQKEVHPVEGQVLDANDQPAAGALVIFHPVKADDPDLNKPRAYVDDKGHFSLTTYEKEDGAAEGDYVVTVEWRPRKKTPFDKAGKDQLEGRYSNPKTSSLRATVDKGPTTLKPFKVE
jgi:hypothetical protein